MLILHIVWTSLCYSKLILIIYPRFLTAQKSNIAVTVVTYLWISGSIWCLGIFLVLEGLRAFAVFHYSCHSSYYVMCQCLCNWTDFHLTQVRELPSLDTTPSIYVWIDTVPVSYCLCSVKTCYSSTVFCIMKHDKEQPFSSKPIFIFPSDFFLFS